MRWRFQPARNDSGASSSGSAASWYFHSCGGRLRSAKGAARTTKRIRNWLAPRSVLREFLKKRGTGANTDAVNPFISALPRLYKPPSRGSRWTDGWSIFCPSAGTTSLWPAARNSGRAAGPMSANSGFWSRNGLEPRCNPRGAEPDNPGQSESAQDWRAAWWYRRQPAWRGGFQNSFSTPSQGSPATP